MKTLCPCCERDATVETVVGEATRTVRGEAIVVPVEYCRCEECGGEAENTLGPDSLEAAYREYRRRHGMLQPEEIRDWRKSRGLTQRELSSLLGWGGATLSRYENGALQEEAHEKFLRLATDPQNLLRLIEEKPEALPAEKRSHLLEDLAAEVRETRSCERALEDLLGRFPVDECSGYREFDFGKLVNTVLFFCRGGQLQTKLNKLLFYADFKHFKEYTVSITGARYAHLPYGPAPNHYKTLFAVMVDNGQLSVDEFQVGAYWGEVFTAVAEPDLASFSDSELDVLTTIKEKFRDFSAAEIKEFSHREDGYQATQTGQLILYRYASTLHV